MEVMLGRCRRGAVEEPSKGSHQSFAYLGQGLERGEGWSYPRAVVRTEVFLPIELRGGHPERDAE